MENERGEVRIETDEARAGSTPHIVRWILTISLLITIALLSVIWITGAVRHDDGEKNNSDAERLERSQPTHSEVAPGE